MPSKDVLDFSVKITIYENDPLTEEQLDTFSSDVINYIRDIVNYRGFSKGVSIEVKEEFK